MTSHEGNRLLGVVAFLLVWNSATARADLAGVTGEYFVAGELSRRGHIASISLRNSRRIGILATNAKANRSVTIQCKTSQVSKSSWLLSDKCESFVSENHYYIFVALAGPLERPRYHIVPSADVAAYLRKDHRALLDTPGRAGRRHVDNSTRKFDDRAEKYLERWDLLGL